MNFIFNEYQDGEDQHLIKHAMGGSKVALEHLLRRHYQFIYNVALRFVLNPADAEDLTQEVIIKVITNLGKFKFDSAFRTWLYRIVFNHFLNTKKRKMETMMQSFEEYGNSLDSIPLQTQGKQEEVTLKEEIEDAKIGCMTGMLLCLSREQRLVYVLGEVFEVPSGQGAELLDLSPENFRKILSRARKDLYQFMNHKCGLINKANPCRCPKKTKGFIKAGWVNPDNLQFNNGFVSKISALAFEKANQCESLLEEKYGALFKDHPYYNKNESTKIVNDLAKDPEVRNTFNLN